MSTHHIKWLGDGTFEMYKIFAAFAIAKKLINRIIDFISNHNWLFCLQVNETINLFWFFFFAVDLHVYCFFIYRTYFYLCLSTWVSNVYLIDLHRFSCWMKKCFLFCVSTSRGIKDVYRLSYLYVFELLYS